MKKRRKKSEPKHLILCMWVMNVSVEVRKRVQKVYMTKLRMLWVEDWKIHKQRTS